ncbi:hypothetical protein [Actinokineospora terrae]|uniref:Uncharacterized protein n=1 Tax=Actinokineospora terrae TaxID=155974 RepID=A0A1H9XHG1_9PSEU|nr:hypothetical protein [Actinokineospora terrae]SES45564.1 hypothetical protein SAMN04487818_115112 [Actinokineospora terrae]
MARSSSDAGIQDAFTAAGLTRHQRALLHTVLRALDTGSAPGFHASTSDSALVALIRAHDVLRSHAEHEQPQGRLLLRVLRTNSLCIANGLAIFPPGSGRASLRAAIDELAATTTALTTTDRAHHRAVTRASAAVLDPLITAIADAVTDRFHTLWDTPTTDAKAAAEIAVSVHLAGRDRAALANDLTSLLTGSRPSAADIAALLWPPPRRHHVTVLVSGARSLADLDHLLPGARQWPITEQRADLGALLERLKPITRGGVLVRVPIDAADTATAVTLGRRAISEALDQYVAGNRVADLSLAGPWQVIGPDGRAAIGETVRAGVTRAEPLSSSRSDGLRPALRIAHIAQRVEAPMASAALSWSAIESTGLDVEKASRLARACAIQTLRYQVIDAHTQLRLTVAEQVRRLHLRARKAKDELRRAQRALENRASSDELADRVARASQSWSDTSSAHEDAVTSSTALLAAIDAHVPTIQTRSTLAEPDRWLDLLRPARDGEDPGVDEARRAVTTLAAFAGGLSEETILLWRERLARPPLLAKWLQERQDTYSALLEWLYTTRNTAFHLGRFTGPIDIATAHAGRAIVDMMLEVLGTWHSTQHRRGQDATPPADILKRLAQRKDALSALLHTADTCHPLSVQHITGPDEAYWSGSC